uniref:Uncharacterized protein n=1 Tax=Anguilla anguilla TaxID=7936 RepID=A0A0E9XHB2_ANGAN
MLVFYSHMALITSTNKYYMLEVILFTFFKFQNSDFAHFLENVVYTNLNCH